MHLDSYATFDEIELCFQLNGDEIVFLWKWNRMIYPMHVYWALNNLVSTTLCVSALRRGKRLC